MAEAGFTLLLAPSLAFFALLHLGQQVESPPQSPHSPHSLTFVHHTPPWLLSILKVYSFFMFVSWDLLITAVLFIFFGLLSMQHIIL